MRSRNRKDLQKSSNTEILLSKIFPKFAQQSPDVFWVLNPELTDHIYVSPSYEKVWGRDLNALLGKIDDWISTIHPEDQHLLTYDCKITKLSEEGPDAKYYLNYRIIRPNGEVRWINDQSFPIFDDTGNCIAIAGIARDITEDIVKTAELLEAKNSAESANNAKSDFLAAMSHELRTPLNTIIGLTELLQLQVPSAQHQDYLSMIQGSSCHLLSLINDILDFVRIEAGKLGFEKEPIDLLHLLDDIVGSFTFQAQEKDLILVHHSNLDPDLVYLGDARRLRQILVNLISNALKFTPAGRISVNMQAVSISENTAKLTLMVSDTGVGISEADMPRIFERFTQLRTDKSSSRAGTGLGLTITKQLIELMQGTIEVTSKLNMGTTFTCHIPLAISDAPIKKEDSESLSYIEWNKWRESKIMVVEDNPYNQKVMSLMLNELGLKAEIFSDAERAIAGLVRPYDLIVVDIGLPRISGIELAREIRAGYGVNRQTPIIALTAHVLPNERDACFGAGINDILLKPISLNQLKITFNKWLRLASRTRCMQI